MEEAMWAVVLEDMKTYIYSIHNIFAAYIATKPILELFL